MSHRSKSRRPALRAAATGLLCLALSAGAAFAADDDEDKPAKPDVPNIYLDLRTIEDLPVSKFERTLEAIKLRGRS